jgi:glycine hydroxymethyltransferase
MLVDLSPRGVKGEAASKALERAGIACNKNLIPFDPEPAEIASGLRLSSNAGTARGFGTEEFRQVARWILAVLDGIATGGSAAVEARTRAEVNALCRLYPIYEGM